MLIIEIIYDYLRYRCTNITCEFQLHINIMMIKSMKNGAHKFLSRE